jgi:excinuclease ABC subunit C
MLMETVVINAGQALGLHKTKRSTDLVTRSKALAEIQEAIGLPDAPLRIECIDVSHISGTNVVASLVVFEDGIPKKKDYRQFIIEDPRDDTASIAQVVARRFKEHDEKRPYRPNLLVIDGGLPQVNAAAKALEGRSLDRASICAAQQALADDLDPPHDLHGPPEMKRHLARVLTERVLLGFLSPKVQAA